MKKTQFLDYQLQHFLQIQNCFWKIKHKTFLIIIWHTETDPESKSDFLSVKRDQNLKSHFFTFMNLLFNPKFRKVIVGYHKNIILHSILWFLLIPFKDEKKFFKKIIIYLKKGEKHACNYFINEKNHSSVRILFSKIKKLHKYV